jgi:hypothetical protein
MHLVSRHLQGLCKTHTYACTTLAFLSMNKFDGFVKSPSAVLRCIFRRCDVPYVRLTPQDLRALHLELFTLPSF